MKRRSFIKNAGLASTALFAPAFLQGANFGRQWSSRTGKILIVIQLSGGNDGLNTIVPYGNDIYYQQRPQLAIPQQEVLKLNDHQGLHPALAPLRALYDQGELSIINSVGYPNPDRSHFRSMDIWHTGSSAEEAWSTGWLGRYLDHNCMDRPVHHALEVNDGLSLAMKGDIRSGFAMSNPRRLNRAISNPFLPNTQPQQPATGNLGYLYKTLTDTRSSANYLHQQSQVHQSSMDYPRGNFGQDLKQIAELITAETDTKVYYASLGGFDTHAGQKNQQKRLLTQYANGVSALVKDLKQHNLFDDVLIMTFSEFGRRLAQNASGGTDHGTANNTFFIGGQLKQAGFYNAAPNLGQLEQQDLIHEVDFRRIYTTVLDKWLEADATTILKRDFQPLDFI